MAVHLLPLTASLASYASIILVCEIARRIVFVQTSDGSTARLLLLEAIGSAQVVACVYENGFVMQHYGLLGFFVAVALLLLVHANVNRGAMVNALGNLEALLWNRHSPRRFATLLAGQVAGALLGFRLAQVLWSAQLCASHAHVHTAGFHCAINYKAPFAAALLYEVAACFAVRYAVGYVAPANKMYAVSVATATGLTMSLYLIGVPGLNPTVALGRLYGCERMSAAHFVSVYCCASAVGWLAAAYVQHRAATVGKKRQ